MELSKSEIKDRIKVIKKAENALYAVNREHFEQWMCDFNATNTEDHEKDEIEVIMISISDCLDVLKEMLRDLEAY